MTSLDRADPTVSAVVQIASPEEREAANVPTMHDNQALAQVKGSLTKAGFEVHAPFATSFSIGGRQSLFEKYFGQSVVVSEGLMSSVTLEGGGTELAVDALPDDIRPLVKSISFMPPPNFYDRTS